MSQTYPVYTPPPATGIEWASGQGKLQPLPNNYQCKRAAALAVVSSCGGELKNAAVDKVPGVTEITGVDPGSEWQPWFVEGPLATGFLGPSVEIMWRPNDVNGGGEGNPGHWAGWGTADVKWVPTPPTPPPLVPPGIVSTVPFGGTGNSILGVQPSNDLGEVLRLVKLMAAKEGIS